MRNDILDIVAPSAALLPIEDHVAYCNLRHLRLTGSLKGDRFDQVVTLINRLTPSEVFESRYEVIGNFPIQH